MTAPLQPAAQPRKRYRMQPSGCCDMPRIVRLTDAEAAPGLARGVLQALPDEASPQPAQPQPANPAMTRSHP